MNGLSSVFLLAGLACNCLWLGRANAQGVDACLFAKHESSVVKITYNYNGSNGEADSVQGTGFIVSGGGYVLTAAHVLEPI